MVTVHKVGQQSHCTKQGKVLVIKYIPSNTTRQNHQPYAPRTYIVLIVGILIPQMCQQFNFRLGLHQKWFLGFDNLNGHFLVRFHILRPYYLSKRSLPDPFFDFIAIVKNFTGCDNVIVIFVIPSVIVGPTDPGGLLCPGGLFLGPGQSSRFSIFIIDGIDLFVRINQ